MSNIYIQEPPTEGKVLLETSVGDVEIELWSKETPLACRNFIQLCLERYYDKTEFHRVVKNFIVQGGDPTNTGRGGDAVFEGGTFKDEFHSRLRFVRRGLVAMANTGDKNSNASQFFFTLGPTPELQNKHTIFGKIAGDTIYNVMKLQEGEIEDESPVYPNKILKSKVLINPFTDIIPREAKKSKSINKESKIPNSKSRATKDFKLLSFGDEAEEDEEDLKDCYVGSAKSSHDLLDDPKLLKESGMPSVSETSKNRESSPETTVESIRDKLKQKKNPKIEPVSNIPSDLEMSDDEESKAKAEKDRIRKEIKALKREMKGNNSNNDEKDSKKSKKEQSEALQNPEEENNELLAEFHKAQTEFSKKSKHLPKAKTSAREDMTMKLLEKFKNKIKTAKEIDEEKSDDDEDSNWMTHTLKFEDTNPVLAKDASTKDDDWFDIYDPRNPINKRRREAKKK